ncbi:MAG TPA: GNAT family N-acetyltransferase [Ottowia sp.]|nr:GNAT family N-acetyltransferase [Burkholderiales bacterium]HQO51893.1 GNAT family N-acetyltransferase [Ottowia sp.]
MGADASRWRIAPLAGADVPALLQVQAACYGPALLEDAAVYARRLASPAHCGLGLHAGGALAAYLAAHWSVWGAVTPLHGDFAPQAAADTLYLHDLAVRPEHAGQGLGQRLLAAAWRQARARGVRQAALVSVQGTRGFWQRQGFVVALRQPPALASYGSQALYMTRRLDDAAEPGSTGPINGRAPARAPGSSGPAGPAPA